ncbi:M14 family zinc carboxypeptidase [Peribacillus sp. CSMR9]|uniref:M14 family zinc carboxypeptidase n=1 Tax=Peribacillus sp. CSMR9 TaxID=2981350 RepID=UPI0029533C21|nr:M14 family zinc carboxypeptidase [Peribacillus sp. CSMR9]
MKHPLVHPFNKLIRFQVLQHAELGKKLEQIASDSQGKVKVDVAGYSNRNREIYKATVGTGDKVVLIQSEIHGNEKTGTDAILNILKFLGTNSPEAEKIRKDITLVALPKMNPDAAELNRRGNDMTWAEVVEQFPQIAGANPSWNYTYKMNHSIMSPNLVSMSIVTLILI